LDETIIKDFGTEFAHIWEVVQPHTIVSLERAYATYKACRYVSRYRIAGDFAECGVFKGGMTMLAAHVFGTHEHRTRHLWLYDTFEGMTPATEFDGQMATDYDRTIVAAGIELVRENLSTVEYPTHRLHFIQGDVCKTLAKSENLPERIAVLRLDTDWYDSTKAELETLYDRVAPGGVVLCDDYGFWQGAKIALDEFIERLPYPIYLSRTDQAGVEFVKPRLL
jgi:O-methyltransferase